MGGGPCLVDVGWEYLNSPSKDLRLQIWKTQTDTPLLIASLSPEIIRTAWIDTFDYRYNPRNCIHAFLGYRPSMDVTRLLVPDTNDVLTSCKQKNPHWLTSVGGLKSRFDERVCQLTCCVFWTQDNNSHSHLSYQELFSTKLKLAQNFYLCPASCNIRLCI